jgi:hypothetical protein
VRVSAARWQLLTAQGAACEVAGKGMGQVWPWGHTQVKVWGEEKEVTVGAAAAALARGGGGKGVVAGRDELGLASAWS